MTEQKETAQMLDTPRFTADDVLGLRRVLVEAGCDPKSITFTFGQRHDLSSVPWQLHVQGSVPE